MDTRIQELTRKIYEEGVEKGKSESDRLISEATAEKAAILAAAKEEARQIIETAEREAASLRKNTEAELKLFASQALETLKSEIADLITGRIVKSNVKAAVGDKAFIQKLILETSREWVKSGGITIETAASDDLIKYFESNAKDLLLKSVNIEKVNGKDTSFTIKPAGGSYKVTFGEEEFIAFFKEFLRPQLVEMLF
jgi:V/A-type H+-transporting ATPase subunit E